VFDKSVVITTAMKPDIPLNRASVYCKPMHAGNMSLLTRILKSHPVHYVVLVNSQT